MNPLALVSKLLLVSAVNQYSQNQANKAYAAIQDKVKNILMAYYRGPIVDLLEQEWIMKYKIEPKVMQMSAKELDAIIKKQKKNEALIKKHKKAKYELVTQATIRQHHIDYLEYKQNKEAQAIRMAEEEARMKKEAEAERIRNMRLRQMREANILINGESDSEVAEKFFN